MMITITYNGATRHLPGARHALNYILMEDGETITGSITWICGSQTGDTVEGLRTLLEQELASDAVKHVTRRTIARDIGDTETLLGTTSDATQLLLYETAKLATALSTANSLAEVRAAAQPLADLLGPLATAVDAGTVKLPYQTKGGAATVLPEIEQRATAVAEVLQANNGGN